MNKRTRGILLLAAGFVMLFAAVALYWAYDDRDRLAGETSAALLQELEADPAPPAITEEVTITTPEGYELLGAVHIPALDISLPVLATWDEALLDAAPCRYSGSLTHRRSGHHGPQLPHPFPPPVEHPARHRRAVHRRSGVLPQLHRLSGGDGARRSGRRPVLRLSSDTFHLHRRQQAPYSGALPVRAYLSPFTAAGQRQKDAGPPPLLNMVKAIPVRNGLDIMVPTLPMGGACKMYAL